MSPGTSSLDPQPSGLAILRGCGLPLYFLLLRQLWIDLCAKLPDLLNVTRRGSMRIANDLIEEVQVRFDGGLAQVLEQEIADEIALLTGYIPLLGNNSK